MQQDWQPEAEHGAMYSLVGPGYTVDTNTKSVTGPLVAQGVDTGVEGRGALRRPQHRVQARPGADVRRRQDHVRGRQHRRRHRAGREAAAHGGRDLADDGEPADPHVGPGELPGADDDQAGRRDRRDDRDLGRGAARAAGVAGHHQEVAVRPELRRLAVPVRLRPEDRPAGLRHGRALHLRERDRAVEEADRVGGLRQLRLLDLPRAAGRAGRQTRRADAVPQEARADHAAGAGRLPEEPRPDQRPDRQARRPVPDRLDLHRR